MLNKILTENQGPLMPASVANAQDGSLRGAATAAGWMQGTRARLQDALEAQKDNRDQGYLNLAKNLDVREEKKLSMKQEAFSWQRQDRNQQQFIKQGMATAFQQGGYEGVIDFLGANDPDQAIDFTRRKVALDQDLMKSDVMRSLVPSQQVKAMSEAYEAIGQLGFGLLKAPDKDKPAMYQQLLPIIRKINPNAPDTLNEDANAMFMLASAQAMPANILFANQKQKITSESALGKLDVDIRSRLQQGETLENSPTLATMIKEYQSHGLKFDKASQELNDLEFKNQNRAMIQAKDQAQAMTAQYSLTSNMNSKLQAESKTFIALKEQMNTFDGAIDAISHGAGGAAQTAAYRTMAMMFNKGALSDPDVAAFAGSDSTTNQALKKLRSAAGEQGLIALNPSEIQRLQILKEAVLQKAQEKQTQINDRYKGMAAKYGVDPKELSIYEPAAPDYYLGTDVPPDIAAQAKAAIAKGASRDAVNARIQQIMSTGKNGPPPVAPQQPQNNPAPTQAQQPPQPGTSYGQ